MHELNYSALSSRLYVLILLRIHSCAILYYLYCFYSLCLGSCGRNLYFISIRSFFIFISISISLCISICTLFCLFLLFLHPGFGCYCICPIFSALLFIIICLWVCIQIRSHGGLVMFYDCSIIWPNVYGYGR